MKMNRFKIIKKGTASEKTHPPQTAETVTESGLKKRETARIVEDWVTEWRCRKQNEVRRAFAFNETIERRKEL